MQINHIFHILSIYIAHKLSLLVENDVSLGDDIDQKTSIMTEIDLYLRAKTNANVDEGLKDFVYIQQLFLKYNCIRSSEAICERLFSYAGVYFTFDKTNSMYVCMCGFVLVVIKYTLHAFGE